MQEVLQEKRCWYDIFQCVFFLLRHSWQWGVWGGAGSFRPPFLLCSLSVSLSLSLSHILIRIPPSLSSFQQTRYEFLPRAPSLGTSLAYERFVVSSPGCGIEELETKTRKGKNRTRWKTLVGEKVVVPFSGSFSLFLALARFVSLPSWIFSLVHAKNDAEKKRDGKGIFFVRYFSIRWICGMRVVIYQLW